MSRRIGMVARGVMYDIRHPAKRRPSDWRRAPGISAARAGERDLVVRGVGPWISWETDVVLDVES